MKKIFFSILLSLFWITGYSQSLNFGLAYQHQKAFEWEKMIEEYNQLSPWNENKQPFLTGVLNCHLNYQFKSSSIFKSGIGIDWNFSKSFARNQLSNVSLYMNQFQIGYIGQIFDSIKTKNFFIDFGLNFNLNSMYRLKEYVNVNEKRDDTSLGYGGNLDLKIGYKIRIIGLHFFSPFIGCGGSMIYTPESKKIFLPKSYGQVFDLNYTFYLKAGLLIEISLKKKKDN